MPAPPHANDHQVVVAIDLGTHGTGFGWAEVSALNKDLTTRAIHFEKRWRDVDYPKNLSALLLDPSGAVAAWGYEAKSEWEERLSQQSDGWGYTYAFKMALKPGAGPDVSTARGAVDLSDIETVVRLVGEYLTRIKDKALAEIGISQYRLDHVRWCITVPAIWNDAERDLVRRAAGLAGIPNDDHNLLIAVEPEAAALFCSIRLTHVLDAHGNEDLLELRSDGTRFMVVDCGGGTVDLTAHRTSRTLGGEIRLTDIGLPTGGKLGSEYVNHAFRTITLAARLGQDTVARLERECPAAMLALIDAWEAAKTTLRAELDGTGGARITSRVRILLPHEIVERLDADALRRVKEASGGFEGRIVMEPQEVQALLDGVVDEIMERIEQQLIEMRRVTERIGGEVLLLVGGFARSEYLRHRVRAQFAERVTVMAPPDPAIAVLFGAVHYCYDPSYIRSRRAKLTYGFSISYPFETGVDPVEKRYKDDEGNVLCSGRFEIAVRNGEAVEVDEPYYLPVYPVMADQQVIPVRFFATGGARPPLRRRSRERADR